MAGYLMATSVTVELHASVPERLLTPGAWIPERMRLAIGMLR